MDDTSDLFDEGPPSKLYTADVLLEDLLVECAARHWDYGATSEDEEDVVSIEELFSRIDLRTPTPLPAPPPPATLPLLPGIPLSIPGLPTKLVNPDLSKSQVKNRSRRAKRARERYEADLAAELDTTNADDGTHFVPGAPPAPLQKRQRLKYLEHLKPVEVAIDFGSRLFRQENVSTTSFQGLRQKVDSREYGLDELQRKKYGFKVLDEFNGRDPGCVVDKKGRCIVGLAGVPGRAQDWPDVTEQMGDKLASTANRMTFDEKHRRHRRGNFRVQAHGWTFGGGKREAGATRNSESNEKVWQDFLGDKDVQRVAHFQDSAFQLFAPRLWAYYFEIQAALLLWCPSLVKNFAKSVFAAITVNFGPRTVSFLHCDDANLSWGWCAISAFGNFSWKLGGHLILWDLKLIIPFPPGSTILLPSALLAHSNVPIRKGEFRYSITQYSSAGLFRWVDNGMQSDESFRRSARSKARIMDWEEKRKAKWFSGIKMFSIFRAHC